MSFVPVTWRPDLDCSWEVAPGALKECRGFIPTKRGGYATFSMEDSIASYTSTTEPLIAGITRKSDGTARFFIFNKQSIYEFTSTSAASDRSSATYSSSTTDWTWTQFGDQTIATNYYNTMQASSSTTFADLTGAPKARLVASNMGFVMAANLVASGGTTMPDAWHCCDQYDTATWTETATNQATSARLYDTPGPIRALEPLRDYIVAYKDDSIYVGEYVGDVANRIIWGWRLVSSGVGCQSAHGVARVNDMHYFMHRSGFYVFDGAAVRKIGDECTNFLFDGFTAADPTTAQVTFEQRENVVVFTWSVVAGKRDCQAFYNIVSGKWSYNLGQVFTAGAVASYYPTGIVKASQADIIAFNSSEATSLPTLLMIGKANTAITAYAITYRGEQTNTGMNIRMRPGVVGDGENTLTLSQMRVRFPHIVEYGSAQPSATFLADAQEYEISYNSSSPNGEATSNAAVWNSDFHRFDGRASGLYVNANMTFDGIGCEISGLAPVLQRAGRK